MPRTNWETEVANSKRLHQLYPDLKTDKNLRNAFHQHLAEMEKHGDNKPTTEEELIAAYKDFLESR